MNILRIKQWSKGAHVALNNVIGPFLEESSLLFKKLPFSPENLGTFLAKINCSLGKLFFSLGNLFYSL
jgi:hypothetical protein